MCEHGLGPQWQDALGGVVLRCMYHATKQGASDKLRPADIPEQYLRSHGWTRAANIIVGKWDILQSLSDVHAEQELTNLSNNLMDIANEWFGYAEYERLFGHYRGRLGRLESYSPMPHFHTAPYAMMLAAQMVRNRPLRMVCHHDMVLKEYTYPREQVWVCTKCDAIHDDNDPPIDGAKYHYPGVAVPVPERDIHDLLREEVESRA